MHQEILSLRRYRQHTTVYILVPIARVVRWRSRSRVEVTGSHIPIISPGHIHNMVHAIPAGIQFVVVAMEGSRASAKQEAVPIMRDVAHADVMAECWICIACSVGGSIVDIQRLVACGHERQVDRPGTSPGPFLFLQTEPTRLVARRCRHRVLVAQRHRTRTVLHATPAHQRSA